MDKFRYLKPVWFTASLMMLMMFSVTKGASKYINLAAIPNALDHVLSTISTSITIRPYWVSRWAGRWDKKSNDNNEPAMRRNWRDLFQPIRAVKINAYILATNKSCAVRTWPWTRRNRWCHREGKTGRDREREGEKQSRFEWAHVGNFPNMSAADSCPTRSRRHKYRGRGRGRKRGRGRDTQAMANDFAMRRTLVNVATRVNNWPRDRAGSRARGSRVSHSVNRVVIHGHEATCAHMLNDERGAEAQRSADHLQLHVFVLHPYRTSTLLSPLHSPPIPTPRDPLTSSPLVVVQLNFMPINCKQ